jgi:molecular chaperone GrpE
MQNNEAQNPNLDELNKADLEKIGDKNLDRDDQVKIEQDKLKTELLQLEIEDWKQKALRLGADLQNSQKQNELEISQAKKSAKKQIARQMLEFLNTLYLSFSFFPESEDKKVKNLVLTLKGSQEKLIKDLKEIGVEIIEPKIGENFNPQIMTPLSAKGEVLESDNEAKVSQIASLGLIVDGQVVQPSVVII